MMNKRKQISFADKVIKEYQSRIVLSYIINILLMIIIIYIKYYEKNP